MQKPKFKFNKHLIGLLALFFFLLFVECAMHWIGKNFGKINLDEIALVLQTGRGGVDRDLLFSFLRKVVLRAGMYSVLLTFLCGFKHRFQRTVIIAIAVVLGGLIVVRGVQHDFQVGSFMPGGYTDFYEREYVAPDTADISFPRKRNVVVIALESMEKSFADESVFGPGGLTPNITRLEQENVSFDRYNSAPGFTHTIAAITGFVSGLPLLYTSYKKTEKMRGAHGIGEIFAKNGYQTWAMFPASGEFSLKSDFLARMGFENIIDGVEFRLSLDYKPDATPFQGIDDATLFREARKKFPAIIKSGRPYFVFMETVNTHCYGIGTDGCAAMGFERDTMSGIAKCDDKIIYDFVAWLRKADPTAVIILLNDHEQKSGQIARQLKNVKNRNLANVFINTNVFAGADLTRPVLAADFMPTIIESAGGIINGCKLGLGVSLTARCADVQTLRERFGDADLAKYLQGRNKMYYKLNLGDK